MGNRYIRDSRSSPTEHQVQNFPDDIPCLRHERIAQVILEVTRDSQVTGSRVGHVRTRHRPKTWDCDTAQPVITHNRDIAYAIAIAKTDRSRLESC